MGVWEEVQKLPSKHYSLFNNLNTIIKTLKGLVE